MTVVNIKNAVASGDIPGTPRPAVVVFGDNCGVWWLRFLRRGFRHCFVAVLSAEAWVVIDPLLHYTELTVLPGVGQCDVAAAYREKGFTVVETTIRQAPLRCAPVGFHTCVEAVKRVLGIHARVVTTPWQLYRHILQRPADVMVDRSPI